MWKLQEIAETAGSEANLMELPDGWHDFSFVEPGHQRFQSDVVSEWVAKRFRCEVKGGKITSVRPDLEYVVTWVEGKILDLRRDAVITPMLDAFFSTPGVPHLSAECRAQYIAARSRFYQARRQMYAQRLSV
jgi:hypothetical protein